MTLRGALSVHDNIDGLSVAAAELFLDTALRKTGKGRATVVLPGGSTPVSLFRILSSERFSGKIPWDRVHLFWGDERCVPPENDESNFKSAYDNLISKVPVPPENVLRIKGELPPAEAARYYEEEIIRFFGGKERKAKGEGPLPSFDLIYLGLGADGHTLSLFPSSKALEEKSRLVIEDYVGKLKSWRVTMTLPLVNRASTVVFLVSGEGKAWILKEVLSAGVGGDPRYPATMVRPASGKVIYLVDKAAAALL